MLFSQFNSDAMTTDAKDCNFDEDSFIFKSVFWYKRIIKMYMIICKLELTLKFLEGEVACRRKERSQQYCLHSNV